MDRGRGGLRLWRLLPEPVKLGAGIRKIGIKAQGLGNVRDRIAVVSRLRECDAESIVRLRIIGIELQGLVEVLNRLIVLSLFGQGRSEPLVCQRERGVQPERDPEM